MATWDHVRTIKEVIPGNGNLWRNLSLSVEFHKANTSPPMQQDLQEARDYPSGKTEESGLLSLSTCKGGAPPCPTQVYLKRLSGQPNLHHHPEATRPFTLPQQKPSGKNKKDVSPPSLGGVSGGLVGSLKSHLYQVAMWHPSLPRVSREAKWGS